MKYFELGVRAHVIQDMEDIQCMPCTAQHSPPCAIPCVGIGDVVLHTVPCTMCCNIPCSAFIHFTEIWHIVCFHYIFFWVIWKQYSHSECSTIAVQVGTVIHICDDKSVHVLFTPKLQVCTKLSWY